MTEAQKLIKDVEADGVQLTIEGDTQLAVEGSPEQVQKWLQVVRENKQGVLAALGAKNETRTLEQVLKGHAIALYCDVIKQTLWLVADEEDAHELGERRGVVYTAPEIRLVASIDDAEWVRKAHRFKDQFDVEMKPPAEDG